MKKTSIPSVHETTVWKAPVFTQELALAKPVAHDEFAFDQVFNGRWVVSVAGAIFRKAGGSLPYGPGGTSPFGNPVAFPKKHGRYSVSNGSLQPLIFARFRVEFRFPGGVV
jgi:hypothetical protein